MPLQGVDGEVDPHLQEARVTLPPPGDEVTATWRPSSGLRTPAARMTTSPSPTSSLPPASSSRLVTRPVAGQRSSRDTRQPHLHTALTTHLY